MSDLPVALHGERITAVVVGGGSVGTRKALALVQTGAQVRVVAPAVSRELEAAERGREVTIIRESYSAGHLDRSMLVVAATGSREVNAQIAGASRHVCARKSPRSAGIVTAPSST